MPESLHLPPLAQECEEEEEEKGRHTLNESIEFIQVLYNHHVEFFYSNTRFNT